MNTLKQFDDPVLYQACDELTENDDISFIDDMMKIMRDNNGVGIAAPQIGISKRAVIVESEVLINPVITWMSEGTARGKEGCLSFPGVTANIERHISVKVDYFDRSFNKISRQFTYFPAVIVQHEIDHLNGICLVGDAWKATKDAK